ncbi:hypothetical protein BGZ61DRAFT_451956 [Ilyonectria robusta]|uniref:uncharacterized protein n=1 Tax=Ilyonectria robusta TaxID=1079257 RepID=UPI001E8E88A7|nr:uncharacterized protein BGZ61DRAFT_451956 [Ilyonectria robusta]KAH8694463.1 hypothetical protein BGZ61DRAFT_451956 [Ilyonectria robusta]
MKQASAIHMDPADIAITDWGKAWYWALTAIFFILGVIFVAVAIFNRKKQLSIFCYLSALSCYTLSMGYFGMAADMGWIAIEVEFVRGDWTGLSESHPTRQVFWIRYLAWVIATPLVTTEIFILVSASLRVILLDSFLIFIVIATGLGGAITPTSYKWAYFFYGAIACAGIAVLFTHGYNLASAKKKPMKQMYLLCSVLTAVVWSGYALAWGLSEGANIISPDGEGLFYGILDLLTGPGFGFLVLLTARRCLCEGGDGSEE